MNSLPLRIGHSVRSDDANVDGKKTVSKPQGYNGNNRDKSGNREVSETIVRT